MFKLGLGGIQKTAGPIISIIKGLSAARSGILALTVAFKGMSTIATVFKVIRVAMISSGIGLIIAGIAFGAYLIIKNWDKIKAWFIKLWANVKKIFFAAWDWIKEMFFNYTPYGLVIKNWEGIATFFTGLWDKVKSGFMKFISWFKEKWDWVNNNILKPLGKVFSGGDSNVNVNHTGGAGSLQPIPVRSGGSSTLTFNPVINLNGAADQNTAQAISAQIRRDFDKRMADWDHNKQRKSMS